MDAAVQLEIADSFARIVFDKPNARANTLNSTVWRELGAAVETVASLPNLKGLILSSAKDGIFLAGADLNELNMLASGDPQAIRDLLKLGWDVLDALESLPIPTVALIDGACLGGGLEVAMACDYRIAGTHPKIKIGLPEVKLGLIPGWGGTQRLPRLVGVESGADLLLTGHALTTASEICGLWDHVIATEELERDANITLSLTKPPEWEFRRRRKRDAVQEIQLSAAYEKVKTLPEDEQIAAAAALRCIAEGCILPLALAQPIETEAFVPLLTSPLARQRLAAFLKK